MKKTILDIFYNAFYQVLVVFLPFITIPYLSRVLGPDLIGINGFIMSVIQFLTILTLSGLGQYGVREIRKVQVEDDNRLSEEFMSLFIYQVSFGILSILIYFTVSMFQQQNLVYYIALLPLLVSGIFDISWFFQGVEEIKRVVFRNTIIKLTTLILILIFVKDKNDFTKYLLIMSIGTLLGNLVLWIPVLKRIKLKFPKFESIKNHKNTLFLLIPQVAIQIYISFDTTLLGIMSDTLQVAYYSQSQKITRILSTIISSISIVLMPRMVALVSQNSAAINSVLKKSFEFTFIIASFFSTILYCNAELFVPWFFGEGYEPMVGLLKLLSVLIILIPVGGVFSNQFAIAIGEDKLYIRPVVIGAVLSLALNIPLIYLFESLGAAITSVLVELFVCIYRIRIIKVHYDNNVLKNTVYFILLYLVVVFLGTQFYFICFDLTILNLVVNSLFVAFCYIVGILLFNNEISGAVKLFLKRLAKR